MSPTVVVKPEILKWARRRVGLDEEGLAKAVGLKNVTSVYEWEQKGKLTLSQLERVAKRTYTPIGYLFLPHPPDDRLPIPDFRTIASENTNQPSPNLLETVYDCQFRQDWLRDVLASDGIEPLPFVGSAKESSDPGQIAENIRRTLGLNNLNRSTIPSWEDALRIFIQRIEVAGIIVMRNGIVGTNTHRKLSTREFRGFCLSDAYAPTIFINGTDAKAAQMFTLAHELSHIWLGQSGVSNVDLVTDRDIEAFCNKVAAETLIPADEFASAWTKSNDVSEEIARLTRLFKVSTLVLLIRAYQAGYLNKDTFEEMYEEEKAKSAERIAKSGGDFYKTQAARLSNRFVNAVISNTLAGRTTYVQAFQLLGIKTSRTFHNLAQKTLGTA